MADNLELLWTLKADNTSAKAALKDTESAVTQLRSTFGSEFEKMGGAGGAVLKGLSSELQGLVNRIPLIGGALGQATQAATRAGIEVVKSASDTTAAVTQTTAAMEESAAATGATEEATAGLTASMGPLVVAVGLAVAAMAAEVVVLYELQKAVIEDAKGFAEFGAELERASEKTKLTVEQLAGLRLVADENNVSFDTLVNGLSRYLKNLEAASTNTSLRDEFKKLGIDAEAAAKSPQAAIQALFVAFDKLGPSIQENEVAIKLLSRSGIELIPVFRSIHGDLDDATESAKKFGKSLSEDDARQAQELKKALVDMQAQLDSIGLQIGKEVAPAVLLLAQAFGSLAAAVRPFFELVAAVDIPILKSLGEGMESVAAWINVVTGNWKGLNEQQERYNKNNPTDIPALKVTGPEPAALPTDADNAKRAAENNISALKAASEQAKQTAADQISAAENAFKLGKQSRDATTENVISALTAQSIADRQAIQAEIDRKEAEIAALDKLDKDKASKTATAEEAILNLRQELFNKGAELERNIAKRRTDDQVAENQALLAHEKAKLQIALDAGQSRIQLLDAEVAAGRKTAEQGEKDREAIEGAGFKARRQVLNDELNLAGADTDKRRSINDEIKKLDQEITDSKQAQGLRRTAIAKKEADDEKEIQLGAVDTDLQIANIRTQNTIASYEALAAAGVISAENAQKQITAARLKQLDIEKEAINAKLTAAGSIADPSQRAKEEAALNNQLKVLTAERTSITQQGNRDVQSGRDADIANLRKYRDDYVKLAKDVADLALQIRQTVLDAIVTNPNNAVAKIREQESIDIAAITEKEKEQVKAIQDQIIKLEEKKKTTQGITSEEQDILNKFYEELGLVKKLSDAEKARAKAEADRLALEAKRDSKAGGFFGGLSSGAVQAIDPLKALEQGLNNLDITANAVQQSLGAVFSGIAQGVGDMVKSFVLTGSAGTSFRKMAAEVVASLAQMATVQALFQLAEGLAYSALAYFTGDPRFAEAAGFAYASAAAFGVIAGVATIAGRALAGNQFKDQGGSGSGSGSTAGSGSRSSGSTDQGTNTITQNRNTHSTQTIYLHVESNDSHIVKVVDNNVANNGKLRDVIVRTAATG